jgi:hypothetical protein
MMQDYKKFSTFEKMDYLLERTKLREDKEEKSKRETAKGLTDNQIKRMLVNILLSVDPEELPEASVNEYLKLILTYAPHVVDEPTSA